MSIKTRSVVECPIFGFPNELKTSMLPTYKDVILHFLFVKNDLENNKVNRNRLVTEASEAVATAVENIYKKANVPILSHQRVVALIQMYQKKRKDILKPYKQRKNVASYKAQLQTFVTESNKLFDFAACKCPNFEACVCPKHNKVS